MRSLFLSLTLLFACAVHADSRELPSPDPDTWWFEVAPYLWGIAIEADAEIGPVDADTDIDFGDVLDSLNGALMLHGEAHKGPWTIFADINYSNLETDKSFGPMNGSEIDVELKQTILEVGGGYGFGKNKTKFDVLFGGRALFLDTDIDITLGQAASASTDRDLSHFGPLVGGRLTHAFNSRWWTSVRADVSGFGIDDTTIFSATGLFGYRFTEMLSLGFGYRYMTIDIEEGNLDLELQYHGPLLGLGFRF